LASPALYVIGASEFTLLAAPVTPGHTRLTNVPQRAL